MNWVGELVNINININLNKHTRLSDYSLIDSISNPVNNSNGGGAKKDRRKNPKRESKLLFVG